MKKNTTPTRVLDAINSNKLSVVSGEIHSDDGVKDYQPDQFVEDLEFLCESGYFANMIDITFDTATTPMTVDIGRWNPHDVYMVIKLNIADDVTKQEIDELLYYIPE